MKPPAPSDSDQKPADRPAAAGSNPRALWSSSKLNFRQYGLVLVGLLIVAGGIVLFAASPSGFIALNADQGTLANGASVQSNSSASDGEYVVFGSSQQSGGGGGLTLGGGANMLVGTVKGSGESTAQAADVATVGGFDRLDATDGNAAEAKAAVATYSANKVRVDFMIGGGSASSELSLYESACMAPGLQANECPVVEVENEPESTDAHTYAATVYADYNAFHASTDKGGLGSASPAIIAAYEGGTNNGGSFTWPETWWNWNPNTNQVSSNYMAQYVDGVSNHPYGHHNTDGICGSSYTSLTINHITPQTGGATCNVIDSALGDRGSVVRAHNETGKPVYVTEVGWPTDARGSSTPTAGTIGTNYVGDSMQWPRINCSSNPSPNATSSSITSLCSGSGPDQGDQCNNVYNFVAWARSTGYVYGVNIFGYNDYGSGATFYGITVNNNGDSSKKPAFYGLAAAAHNQPNSCPNPLTY